MNGQGVLEQELFGFAFALLLMLLGGLLTRLLRLPLLLGYLTAGLIAQALLRPFPSLLLLSSVGVILLLFFLGMEFEWRRLLSAPQRLLISALDLALNFLLPFLTLQALGLPMTLAFLVAMAFYPTSSAITVSFLLQLRRLANPETETVVWVLVGEDLAVILLLAFASGITGGETSWSTVLSAFGFITVMLLAAVALTRPLEWLFARVPAELDNLTMLSAIILISAIAHTFHLSEALGAFLAGLLFNGVREREELEQRLHILRELGTAAFFFAFGLQAPLRLSADSVLLGAGLLLTGVVTKTLTAWGAGKLDKLGPRARRRLLFSLWVRGEFSIIALFMGRQMLPTIWQEALSWFILGSIALGLIAASFADKFAGRAEAVTR